MAHRKWRETKQEPSMLPGPAVPGCSLVSFHFLWAILCPQAVQFFGQFPVDIWWLLHSFAQETHHIPTACGHTIAHRKWKETKLQPGTARPGNRLGYCLVSSHFLRAILCPKAVHNFAFFIHVCPLFSSDPVWRILYPMLKDSELYRAFHQNKVWIWNDYVSKVLQKDV